MTAEYVPNPFTYILARLSLLIFPTARALLYVERVDRWRAQR